MAAAVVTVRLVMVQVRMLFLYDFCAALDMVRTSKELIHLFKWNSFGFRDQEEHVYNQETVDSGKHCTQVSHLVTLKGNTEQA